MSAIKKLCNTLVNKQKVFTATEPGTDGYVGMMLLLELNQRNTVLITFRTLTLQKKLRRSVIKMETGLDTQKAIKRGQIIHSAIAIHMRK